MELNLQDKHAIAEMLLAIADDELIIGHRNSEWCGHAPILEEDIAFANLALDEVGHAMLWYQLYAELIGQDPETTPDQLVFFREAFEFRASQFVTLPKGDWAFSMLRQYLWDALESVRLQQFAACDFEPVQIVAEKILTEEIYHIRHTEAWVRRLGLGTDESNRRMQQALDLIWPYKAQLFGKFDEEKLVLIGLPAHAEIHDAWVRKVTGHLENSDMAIPDKPMLTLDRNLQSVHMIEILAELQQVARLDPDASW